MQTSNPEQSGSLIRRCHFTIEAKLKEAGYEQEAVEKAVAELEHNRFYPMIALLASDPKSQQVLKERSVDEFLEQVNKKTTLDSKDFILLHELFTAIAMDDLPTVKRILADPAARIMAVDVVSKFYGFKIDQARLAIQLIESGAFKQDMIGVTRMTMQLADEVPGWLPTSPAKSAGGVLSIGKAIKKDGFEKYRLGRRVFKDLKNNRVPHIEDKDLAVFDDTLRSLTAHVEMLDDLFDWTANLLAYPSIQLSISIWASLHGVKLKTDEVEALQQSFFQRDMNPVIFRLMSRITTNVKEFLWIS